MTNQEIYDGALRIIGESVEEEDNEDYRERAPYIIAMFCNETFVLDNTIRRLASTPERAFGTSIWLSLDTPFPATPRLAHAACLYLAAMLILDEDMERSDNIYEKYCDSIASIQTEVEAKQKKAEPIPEPEEEPTEIWELKPIINKYSY